MLTPRIGKICVLATLTSLLLAGLGCLGASSLTTVAAATRLAVTPQSLTLQPGQTVQFSAVATWSDGQTHPYGVSYSTTAGTVTRGGMYTAGTVAGTFPVVAACTCGLVDTSRITVALPTATAPTLRALAASRGFDMGAAINITAYRSDARYRQTLAAQYNSVVPENALKFEAVHPGPITYTFTDADAIVTFAQANGMAIHGHTLVWYFGLPAWITGGTFTRAQLLSVLKNHITTVVGRYRGKIASWDVVNEAVIWNGTQRPSVWLNTIGPEYIDSAFVWAHRADPAAKLYYNDDSQQFSPPKADAVLALMQRLRSHGVSIDGVGVQMHLMDSPGVSNYPLPVSTLRAAFARFANAGFNIRVSEMDEGIPDGASAQALAAEGATYRDVLDACLRLPQCVGFSTWGFTDRYSWIPAAYPGFGRGLPFDASYQPKPAFDSLAARLRLP